MKNQQTIRIVTDEEIETASNVLVGLKGELRSQTKRRMDRVPNKVSWNEKLTWIDFDLRRSLENIYCLKLELKHWIKRCLKATQGGVRT
jgi:hypothetical protein